MIPNDDFGGFEPLRLQVRMQLLLTFCCHFSLFNIIHSHYWLLSCPLHRNLVIISPKWMVLSEYYVLLTELLWHTSVRYSGIWIWDVLYWYSLTCTHIGWKCHAWCRHTSFSSIYFFTNCNEKTICSYFKSIIFVLCSLWIGTAGKNTKPCCS